MFLIQHEYIVNKIYRAEKNGYRFFFPTEPYKFCLEYFCLIIRGVI